MRVDVVPPASGGAGSQSVQTLGLYATSNTTGASSSSTFDARSVTFQGAGIASVGYSNGSVVFSVPAGGGGGDGVNILAAGTQTAATTGTVLFSNSNGITFGMSGSSRITASHNGLTTQSGQAVSAANGSVAFETLSFSNANGVSFSTSAGSAIVASHNGLTSQSNQAFSASGGSSAFQTLNFANSNGVTFSNSNGSVIASHNGLTTARASNDAIGLNTAQSNVTWTVNSGGLSLDARGYAGTGTSATNASITLNSNGLQISVAAPGGGAAVNFSAGTTSNNLQSVVFSNSNGVSFGLNGSTITGSVAAGAADGVNILAAGTQTAATTGTVLFQNSNGVTFGMSNSSIVTASHNGLTSQSNQAFSASGGSSAFQTLNFANSNGVTFSNSNGSVIASHNGLTTARASNDGIGLATAQSNVTWTVNSAGLSLDARNYAGTGTTFAGANVSGSITLNSVGINLSLSAAAPGGGAAVNFSAGTTSNNLQTLVFSDGNGVSFGLNGSTITGSVNAGGAGGTASYWAPLEGAVYAENQVGQTSLHIAPYLAPNISFDRFVIPIRFTNATNSTGTVTVTMSVAIYTRTGSSVSLLTSNSQSVAGTFSGTVNNSLVAGPRNITVPMSTSISGGNYYFAFISSTGTGGANATMSNYVRSQINSVWSGLFNAATTASAAERLGLAFYSAATSAFPNSIAFTEMRGTAAAAIRQPLFHLTNGSV